MKLAIVHDYLNQMGGAEKVLLVLHDLFPDAPIYTTIYEPSLVDPAFRSMDVRTTFMQRLPFVHRHHQPFLPVFPFAIESIDLREHDVVLSMSSAWSKNVVTRPEQCHVSYCLTPMRFAWDPEGYLAGERVTGWQKSLLSPVLMGLRMWDVVGANRVDHFIGISSTVNARIKKYYRRDASLIHPPVETRALAAHAAEAGDDGYFLVVARLIPYKRIDLAIEACGRLGVPLKVIGDGRDRPRLQALARSGAEVEFLGWVDEQTKRRHLRRCRAFIFPAAEDFGIAPVEALASGRPVVAYAAGGALDVVEEGVNGLLFREPTADALAEQLQAAGQYHWDSTAIAANAARFDTETFKTRLLAFVEEKAAEHARERGRVRVK